MYHPPIKLVLVILIIANSWTNILAAGITRDVRDSSNVEISTQDGGYFELGATLIATNQILFKGNEDEKKLNIGLLINAGYQWNGLFIDANDDDGFVIGYNALNTERWSYDLVSGVQEGIDSNTSDSFDSLRERKSTVNFGVRATGFYGKNILQLEARKIQGTDVSGFQASVLAGTSWQYRNLNAHFITGLHYSSSSVNDYYWGVRADEASLEFPEYKVNASTTLSAELGVTYPINENWVFRSELNYVYGSKEFAESPLRANDSQHFISANASIIYVF